MHRSTDLARFTRFFSRAFRASFRIASTPFRRRSNSRNSRRRGFGFVTLGLLVVIAALLGNSPTTKAYSISNTDQIVTTTGGGGLVGPTACPAGSVIYQVGARGENTINSLTRPVATCSNLVDGVTSRNSNTGSIGDASWGGAGNIDLSPTSCASTEAIVGMVVHKQGNGYVSGWQLMCGTLPGGGSRTTSGTTFGWSNAGTSSPSQRETIQCPTGMVAVGMLAYVGGIMDRIGFRCGTITDGTQATISMTSASTVVYNSTLALTSSGSSGGGTFAYSKTGSCTVTGSTLTAVGNAGTTCTVTASRAADANYAAASSPAQTITIQKATNTIAFAKPADRAWSSTPFTLAAPTATSGDAPTITSSTTSVCSVSGLSVTMLFSGTCTLVASEDGNTNYNAASNSSQSFVVSPASGRSTFTGNDSTISGTVTGTKYLVERFTSSTTWTAPKGVTNVSYLVVGGGGGGGAWVGGGGGAGGLRSGTLDVPATPITITVGAGGAGSVAYSPHTRSASGFDSTFSSITSTGGGGGGNYTTFTGLPGGSGGGGGYASDAYRGLGNTPATSPSQGNNGSTGAEGGSSSNYSGGGGGGAGGTGGVTTSNIGGSGGIGVVSNITGSATYFAGGGGGGVHSAGGTAGTGGLGGGGSGIVAILGGTATAGSANTGGGGGGAAYTSSGTASSTGGAGGSGIVIIRYAIPATSTPDLANGSDLGESPTDNITSARTLTFEGTAPVDSTVQLSVATASSMTDTDASTGSWTNTGATCAANTTTGAWSCITAANLTPGLYKFRSTSTSAFDGLTDTQTSATALPVTIDTTAPTASLTTATIRNTVNATGQSTETGTAYLVRSSITVANLANITGAADTSWNSAAITTADTDTNISAAGLVDGTYRLYTTDAAGNLSLVSTNSATLDTTAPTVSSLSFTSSSGVDNTYIAGDTVSVTVVFSEVVTVTGTPRIALAGLTSKFATYTSGSGSTSLVFSYTVAAGDTDIDGLSITANTLELNLGTIADNPGNNATLTHVLVGTQAAQKVDTTAPTVTLARSPVGTLRVGQTTTITFTLSEASATFGDDDITVAGGTKTSFTSTSSSIYTVVFTPTANTASGSGTVSVAASVFTDTPGNNNTASSELSIPYDTVVPTVTITRAGAGTIKAGQTDTLTFTLSESSGNFVVGDITVSNGSLSAFSGSGTSYSATFIPATSSSTTSNISVGAAMFTDAANNGNTASSTLGIAIDTVRPGISLTGCASSYAAGATCSLTITLTESVNDLTISDFTVTRGFLSGLSTTGTSRTVTFTAATTEASSANISIAAGSITGASGNTNLSASLRSIAVTSANGRQVITSSASTGAFVAANTAGSARYVIHTFNSSSTWTVPNNVSSVSLLVVGGGGGGASRHAGGGGAGGFAEGSNFPVTAGSSYNVTVGAGGNGGTDGNDGSQGNPSSFVQTVSGTGITATGGGAGSRYTQIGGASGSSSGSGVTTYASNDGGSGRSGDCGAVDWCGGGGGGAGGIGGNAASTNTGGTGGTGRSTSITGALNAYAGGGGGSSGESGSNCSGNATAGGAGGTGGGGAGGSANAAGGISGVNGTTNTGGGGGGGGYCNAAGTIGSAPGGNGGSGFVVVRYALPSVSTPDLATASDSGSASNDNITSLQTLTFTGTSPIGSVVQLSTAPQGTSTSSGTWTDTGTPCVTNETTGDWSCVTSALSVGTYAVRAQATTYLDDETVTDVSASALAITIDTTAPTVSSFTSAQTTPTRATSFTYTLTFSESVTGVVAADFTNTGTALSCSYAPGSDTGATRTVTISSCGQGTVTPQFAASGATDTAGNTGPISAATATSTITRDTTAPTITVTRSGSAKLMAGESAVITFGLSESSANFILTDVSVTGGTLSALSGSGDSYTSTFTPTTNTSGTASISVLAGVFSDAAGNNNTAATPLAITYDTGVLLLQLDAARSSSYAGGSATTWTDMTGNGRNAALVGSPTALAATSSAGRAISLQSNVFGTLHNRDLSNFSGGVTLQATVNFGSADSYERILDFGKDINGGVLNRGDAANSDTVAWFRFGTTNTLTLHINRGASIVAYCTAPDAILNNTVANYAVTLTLGGDCQMYRNGAAITTSTSTRYTTATDIVTRDSNFIGRSNWAADADLNGSVRSLLVYNRGITGTEVTTNYDNERAFTITYDGNSQSTGTAPAAGSYTTTSFTTAGTATTLSANTGTLTRTGLSFTGWNTATDGSGTSYAAGSGSYQTASDVALYARYADITAPTASLTTATIKNTSSTTGQSTETGTAYLVNTSVTVSNLASITGSSATLWNSATISTADTDTSISAAGLADGTYKLYTTDAAGNLSTASAYTVTIDTTPPTVSSVTSSTANGTITLDGTVSIQVLFSEVATVIGTPQLTLETGIVDRVVDYASGSGTNTLTFTYTVQSGDSSGDLDYKSTTALSANGGSIADAVGNAATLTLATPGTAGSLGASKALVITTNPSKIISERNPSGIASGTAFATQPKVSLQDTNNNVVTNDNSTVVTATISSGATPVGTTTATALNGVVTFNNLGITGTAGTTYTITYSATVSGTALTVATQTVVPTFGAATKLSVATQPVGAGAGATLSVQPVVNVLDSGNNIVTDSNVAITVTASGGTLAGSRTVDASNGVATFAGLTFAGTAGTNYSLTFASSPLTSVTSSNFTVSVGDASKLVITTDAATAKYGQAFETQPVISVQDAGSNVVTTPAISITASLSSGTVVGSGTASSSAGVATFSGLGITGTPGTYTVTYSSGSLTSASQSIVVALANQAITFTDPTDRAWSAPTFDLAPSADSGLTVTLTSNTTPVCTVSTFTVTMLRSGTCTLTASQTGNTNYVAATPVPQSFIISLATQASITIDSLDTIVFGATRTLTTTGGSGTGAVTFTTATTGCSIATTTLSSTNNAATTCAITATKAADTQYAAETATQTVTITKADQPTALVLATTTVVYGQTLTLSGSGGNGSGAITFTAVTGTCNIAVDGITLSPGDAGSTCEITITRATSTNYTAKTSSPIAITTTRATPVLGALSLPSKTFEDPTFSPTNPTPTYNASSVAGAFTYSSATSAVATASGTTINITGAGTSVLTASFAPTDTTNFVTTTRTGTLTVNQATPTFTWTNVRATYGDADATITTPTVASTSSTGTFAYTSATVAVATTTSNTLDFKNAGTSVITGTFTPANTTNYVSGGTVTMTVTVDKATPILGALTLATKTFENQPYSPTNPTSTFSSSNVAGAFTYSSATSAVATASGTTITITGAGTSVITATFAPTDTTNFVSETTAATLTVNQATPTFTWSNVTATYGDTDANITAPIIATTSSTGTWSYSSANTTVATTTNNTLDFENAGTSVITATFTPANTTNYVSGGAITMTVTVDKATPILGALTLATKTFEDPNFTPTNPTATFSSSNVAGTYTYSSATTAVATASGTTITITGAGTSVLTATFAPTDTTNFVSETTTASLTVNQATPTFTWSNVRATYGDADATITTPTVATTSSTGTWAYSSANTAVATTTSNTLDFRNAGTSVITATFTPENTTNYVSGRTTTMTVTVSQADQAVLVVTSTTGTYGSNVTLVTTGGTNAGQITWSVANGTASTCAITAGELRSSSKGTCIVTATMADSANYNSVTSSATTVTLAARPLTITADTQNKIYNTPDPALTYVITAGNLVNGDALTGSLTRDAGQDVDNYAIGQNTLNNSNYNITYNSALFTINQADQAAITVTTSSVTYQTAKALEFTGGSEGDYSYSVVSTGTALCSVSGANGSNLTATGPAGSTCTVTVSRASTRNFKAITSVAKTITIETRAITVTATAKQKIYGNADPAFTYVITNGSLFNTDVLSGFIQRTTGENIGTYALNRGTLSNANYTITFVAENLRVNQRPITVTAGNKTKIFGENDPALTYTVTTGNIVSPDLLSGAIERVPGETLGDYNITEGTLDNGNYDITFVNGRLRITGAPQTGFNLIASAYSVVYEESITVSASGGNGLGAVSYATTDGTGACSLASDVLTGEQSGTCTVTATKSAEGGFLEATSNTITVTVDKAAQIITLAAPADRDFTTSAFTLAPVANSGANIAVASNTSNVCQVDIFSVRLKDSGDCIIVASLAESRNYLAASDVVHTFVVRAVVPYAPTITEVTPGNSTISIDFTAGLSGGASITTYKYSVNDGATWTQWPDGSITSPLVIGNVPNSIESKVRIAAVNRVGAGARSNMMAATPKSPVWEIERKAVSTSFNTDTATSATQSDLKLLPPRPAVVRATSVKGGTRTQITAMRAAKDANIPVTHAIISVYQKNGKLLARIKVRVDPNNPTTSVSVPYAAKKISVGVQFTNDVGVSPGGPAGVNLAEGNTFESTTINGLPRIFGNEIPSSISFKKGSSVLSAKTKSLLNAVAITAKARGGLVYVTGYAKPGELRSAWQLNSLARARAEVVAKYLSARGVRQWITFQGAESLSSAWQNHREPKAVIATGI